MLSPATPFPQVGSYGLYQDPTLPPAERISELVRILELGATVALVAFPLRDGAGGNKRVPRGDLLDGTPLDSAEKKEHAELFGLLLNRTNRTPKQKAQKARHDALANRAIWSGCLQRRLDQLSQLRFRRAA